MLVFFRVRAAFVDYVLAWRLVSNVVRLKARLEYAGTGVASTYLYFYFSWFLFVNYLQIIGSTHVYRIRLRVWV